MSNPNFDCKRKMQNDWTKEENKHTLKCLAQCNGFGLTCYELKVFEKNIASLFDGTLLEFQFMKKRENKLTYRTQRMLNNLYDTMNAKHKLLEREMTCRTQWVQKTSYLSDKHQVA
jgi:hypothetical protein